MRTYAPAPTIAVLERLLEEPSLARGVLHHEVRPAVDARVRRLAGVAGPAAARRPRQARASSGRTSTRPPRSRRSTRARTSSW